LRNSDLRFHQPLSVIPDIGGGSEISPLCGDATLQNTWSGTSQPIAWKSTVQDTIEVKVGHICYMQRECCHKAVRYIALEGNRAPHRKIERIHYLGHLFRV